MPGIEISESAKTTLTQLFIETTSSEKLSGTIDLSDFSVLLEANIKNCDIESYDGSENQELLFLINNKLEKFPSMFKMPNLRLLQIADDTRITGTIPSLDFNTKLEEFVVADLNLNGTIPNLKNCVELRKFQVHKNNFSGNLPTLSACTKLELVDISNNNINGALDVLPFHGALSTFNAGNNTITGNIPNLDALTALRDFNVFENSFSGPIPPLSSNLSLKFFRSYGNTSISGPFPAFVSAGDIQNTNLDTFDARQNNLSGPLPPLSTTPNLTFFVSTDGSLSGHLPEFNQATGLTNFEFTNNLFRGTIPPLSANTALKHLNLNICALSGQFPSVENNTNLIALRFNNNKNKLGSPGISGNVPTVSACTSLRVLDVADNSLTGYDGGPFPNSIENIQLGGNNFNSTTINMFLSTILDSVPNSPSPRGVTRQCNIGNNALPTGQGLIDRAQLKTNGWLFNDL